MTTITINNAGKGKPFWLLQNIDNNNNNLKIGIKRISGRVGWFNLEEELEWRNIYQEQQSDPMQQSESTLNPGLYNFDLLTKEFTSQIDGLEIKVNKHDGKTDMTILNIWFPDRVREMLGLDDTGWLVANEYIGDQAIEFSPQRILVYLNQLSTTDNLQNSNNSIHGSLR